MEPKLFVLSGPRKGAILDLEEGTAIVGRETSSRFCIADSRLSRKHCAFVREAGRVSARDLDSLNGTFVNGVPIKERVLAEGDQIQLGDTVLCYGAEARPGESPPQARILERQASGGSTIELKRDRAFYLHPERVVDNLDGRFQTSANLSAWLRISAAIASERSLSELKPRLLELIADLVGADRGALLPAEIHPDLGPVVAWRRDAASGPLPVDVALCRRVEREGVAVLVSEADDARRESLLCVPLLLFDRALGVLYFARSGASFEQQHLPLATAAAGFAAMALENARRTEWLAREHERLTTDLNAGAVLIGESAAMREVGGIIARVAPTDATVLVVGESGTGKELAARTIHARSPRARRCFMAVNCASLGEALLESELFGHERGAFTGAVAQKKGRFEIADGGTLFLDEVGELAPPLQARLLRVLQEREFERVGGTTTIKVDVRIIAATNRNLREAVASGAFRDDLYFRLNVITLRLPPLRERRDDIELLARYFLQKHARQCGRRVAGISPPALQALAAYDWPGNVRELENAIERAVVLGSAEDVQLEELPGSVLEVSGPSTEASMLLDAVRLTKTEAVRRAMEEAGGKYAEAAKLLGVHVNSLHRMIRNLGLKQVLPGHR